MDAGIGQPSVFGDGRIDGSLRRSGLRRSRKPSCTALACPRRQCCFSRRRRGGRPLDRRSYAWRRNRRRSGHRDDVASSLSTSARRGNGSHPGYCRHRRTSGELAVSSLAGRTQRRAFAWRRLALPPFLGAPLPEGRPSRDSANGLNQRRRHHLRTRPTSRASGRKSRRPPYHRNTGCGARPKPQVKCPPPNATQVCFEERQP